MKKIFLIITVVVAGVITVSAQQFTQGGKTLSGRLTNFGLGFTKYKGVDDMQINLNLGVNGAYFVIDKLAITGGFSIESNKMGDVNSTDFGITVGGRYYFAGAFYGGLAYEGFKPGTAGSDFRNYGRVEAGYDYYITDNVFFEPAVYFRKGLSNSDKSSTFGISIGIGVNF
jgi:hypothetical protein